MKKVLLAILLILLGGFITGVLFFTQMGSYMGSHVFFQTENKEFTYMCFSAKGRTTQRMHEKFERFKEDNPKFADLKIYRVSSKNYLNFKKWAEYKLYPEWQYDYLPPWKR